MNAGVKRQWVAALRSGEYEQGQGRLHSAPGGGAPAEYCCLGVLSDLAVRAGVVERQPSVAEEGQPVHEVQCYVYGRTLTASYLAPEVMEWAGLQTNDPFVVVEEEDEYGLTETSYELSELNDGGRGFEVIAAAIERSL